MSTTQDWTDVGLDEVSDVEIPVAPAEDAFIEPVAMEADPTELFPGDTGTLDPAARAVLVDLLRRRYLSAERNPARWQALLAHQGAIESRLHDLFVTLVVDRERGIAYKRQVRVGEVEIPVLLRDEPYTRVETLLLVHLRTLHQRVRGVGDVAARVDAEELEGQVLSYLDPAETNLAARQREVRTAVSRLVKEGFLDEEAAGRFRITPLVEVVLSVERLATLAAWLRSPHAPIATAPDAALDMARDEASDDGDDADGDDVGDEADDAADAVADDAADDEEPGA